MTTDHGARLGEMARAFTAAVMAGDGPALAALFTPDGTYVDGFYGPFTGRAAIAGMLHEHFHGAGRDFRWDMVDPVSDGRIGYVRYLFSYTSTMPEAAGRRVVFAGMGCFELVDGAIARYSEVFERGSALAQLDFAPERIKKALLRWAAADAGRPDAAPIARSAEGAPAMCARYSITTAPEAIARLFRTAGPLPNLPPRYNLAPTQSAPVVRPGGEGRRLDLLRWGLIPSWSKGPDARFSMINARADTLAVKPAYRNALRERRCLVPADGFYEWQGAGKAKRPMRMVRPDRAPFAFAGLWERWQPADGSPAVESFTIVTTDANDRLRPIHDRMPVILDEADWDRWLAGPADAVTGLLRPAPDAALVAYPVSQRVGNVRNDDPDLLLEAPETLLL